MPFLKIFFYLVVLILVLALAYYTTRVLGSGVYGKQESKNMQVLDRMAVGRDSYLLVVRIQERILLMGVSPSGIVKLEELDTYEKRNPAEGSPDFAGIFREQVKSCLNRDEKRGKNRSDGR